MFDLAGFELSDPWFLLAGLLAPFVFVQVNRRRANVTFSSLSLVAGGRRSLRERLVWLPAALLALATLALALALAGPRTGNAVSEVEREGIAIAVAVDRSGSMEARDFVRGDTSTSRLDVVKRIFTVRSCRYDMPKEMPERACLDFYIKRCKGPCVFAQSAKEYREMMDEVVAFLSGRTDDVIRRIRERMATASV